MTTSPPDCEACAAEAVRCLDADYGVWVCLECHAVFTEVDEPVPDDPRPLRRPRQRPEEAAPKRWKRPRPKYEDSDRVV